MVKRIVNLWALIIIACTALLLQCAGEHIAGGGSDVGNGILTGKMINADNTPAVNVRVVLFPDKYNPVADSAIPDYCFDTTDSNGVYRLTVPERSGQYQVFAKNLLKSTAILITGISIQDSITSLTVATLSPCGSIKVTLPDSAKFLNGYIYIPGTGIFAAINKGNTSGMARLDSVPAGKIPMLCYALNGIAAAHIIRYNVSVNPLDSTILFNTAWKYAQKIGLNTTSSGADMSGNVVNFPILVRLNSGNFVFSQAKAAGADIRFAKTDNAFLPYEIERWDSAGSVAEIWVKADTVYGNDSTQAITMYWANPDACDSSSGGAVFDTSTGFQGVWHLAETGNTTAGDATVNHYDGTPAGMTSASAVEGIIGVAQAFNGTSSCISMSNTASSKLNFAQNGNYTMSLWAYVDTIDTTWQVLAGKGHEQYYLKFKGCLNNKATWEFVEYQDQTGWDYTEDSVPPAPGSKTWVYITGVRSGLSQYLYVNGDPAVGSIKLQSGNYSRNISDNFSIGKYERLVSIPYYEGWCYFKGKIDEVRVLSGAQSENWIKLCYMNQKTDDKLVVFK